MKNLRSGCAESYYQHKVLATYEQMVCMATENILKVCFQINVQCRVFSFTEVNK